MSSVPTKLGKFVLKRALGKGGMGTVFLATQEGLEREVALKVLTPAPAARGSRNAQRRFVREASLCSRLSHPNIVKVFDYGLEEGLYFYAMELVRGRSLEALLQEQPVQPTDFVLKVARDLGAAMEHYLPRGILHRDIKPANIMIEPSGRIVLTDFGLAKELDSTDLTAAGGAVGTSYYVAPEAIRGEVANPSSDLYQVGIVLYRMLAGRLPYWSEQVHELLRLVVQGNPAPIRDANPTVSESLENLVLNCMARDREFRYRSAAEFRLGVDAVLRGQPVPRLPHLNLRPSVEPRSTNFSGDDSSLPAAVPPRPADREPVYPPAPRADEKNGERPARPSAVTRRQDGRPPPPGAAAQTDRPRPTLDARPGTGAGVPRESSSYRRKLSMGLLGAAAVLLAVLGFHGSQSARLESPLELRVRTGARRALVEWRTARPCVTALEWKPEAGAWSAATSGTADAHRVELTGLAAGTSHRVRIVLSDGSRSLDYPFKTQAVSPRVQELTVGAGLLELSFTTGEPSLATLRAGLRESRDPAPQLLHRLAVGYEPLDASAAPPSLACLDGLGDETALAWPPFRELLRRQMLPSLVDRVSQSLAPLRPEALLASVDRRLPASVCLDALRATDWTRPADELLEGRPKGAPVTYGSFADGDAAAARLGRDLRERLAPAPFQPPLKTLLWLAPGLLSERETPLPLQVKLLRAISSLRQLDAYCSVVNIPFASGADGLLGQDYRLRRPVQPAQGREAVEVSIPRRHRFVHPWSEYVALNRRLWETEAEEGAMGWFDWRPLLTSVAGLRHAELELLQVELEPHLMFRVTVNDTVTLDFHRRRHDAPGGKRRTEPLWSMGFDPRVLKGGANHVRLSIEAIPGTRYMGQRQDNSIRKLRLVVD